MAPTIQLKAVLQKMLLQHT